MTDTIEGRLVGDDESTADNVKYVPSPVRTVFVASGLDREAQARKDEFDLVHQPIAIEFWADTCQALQARICALEAQAAADAVVAIAVERWVGALGFVANTGQSDWGPLADAFKDVCNAVNERRSALSARKGE